jgi:hypothetical protein
MFNVVPFVDGDLLCNQGRPAIAHYDELKARINS